jgi:hypothetical protein
MQLLEKRPSEGPREVCRAVILIVRRSALVKVDSPCERRARCRPVIGLIIMVIRRPKDCMYESTCV